MKFIECTEIEGHKAVIEIESKGILWDLHNAAEFMGFIFDVKERKLILNFKYYVDYEKSRTSDCKINLMKIISFEVKPRDGEMPFSEDDCLSEIFFDKNRSIITFKFWGGMMIVVKCEEFIFFPPV